MTDKTKAAEKLEALRQESDRAHAEARGTLTGIAKSLASPAPASAQEGQGGLTLPTNDEVYAEVCRQRGERNHYISTNAVNDTMAAVRAILARQPAPVISNAEAATWCRENSLNVPAHWESAPVQGSVVQARYEGRVKRPDGSWTPWLPLVSTDEDGAEAWAKSGGQEIAAEWRAARPVAQEGKAVDGVRGPLPMCETCDDPAKVLADGSLAPCQACDDFAAQQTSAQEGGRE